MTESEALVLAMFRNKLTQKDVAKKMGVTHIWFSRVLNGHTAAPATFFDRARKAIEELAE